ncbi:hypothetical protein SAMN05216559_0770 [Halomicrobium zhouii]|uniref:Uncharacterized protein n=1 Tax=Halomicrobium zhouii TaxID=767519 RepID=A0A1I6KH90_9EURY|nr:hypothetical protein [Halomicrobium zhouii]SFR90240.1 hypothetical protein SAMN05216559_0770 [Halomicrobium zhouii]
MSEQHLDRRTLLGALAAAGATSLAGCSALQAESDSEATAADDDLARELATRFAPTLYFDEHEPWFPTDPRPYASEDDGETVVDGFDAFDGYHERYSEGDPPNPTVFYNAVEYAESPLAVVQFWLYSAFDQFTTNFHWHDWEVLHVFVDTDTGDPQLYVASSHSRKVPNNEFLDPDPETVPRMLAELGSHSTALSVNDDADRFQRLAEGDLFADVTNRAIEGVEDLAEIPLAYGLPRDEGSRLPYVVPAYEGAPLYDHDRLPSVTADSLVTEELTVRAFDELTSPPTDLPGRETGLVFEHEEREETADEADVEYDLVPSSELEHITDFTGPQLSFEFAVPQAVEDAVAGHITTTGAPWDQPRYENPAADVTDPNHRAALADRYDAIGEPAPINTVVTRVTEAVTTDDAPEDEGLTTTDATVESVALLESDPEAVPTFGGVAVVRDVPAGDHRLTVNGAGQAPHSERVSVAGGGDGNAGAVTAAGVDGEIPLVANRDARKLEVGTANADVDVATVALEDDFAGRLYESPVGDDDGDEAVYVHAGGAYTTEVRDSDDEVGAYRVNPDRNSDAGVRIDNPETGKAPLAEYLADVSEETRAAVAAEMDADDGGDSDDSGSDDGGSDGGDSDDGGSDDGDSDGGTETETDGSGGSGTGGSDGSSNAIQGLERALAAVVDAAERAAARAREGDRGNADKQLEAVADRLERAEQRLAEASDDLPESLVNAAENRQEQANRRAEQARNANAL